MQQEIDFFGYLLTEIIVYYRIKDEIWRPELVWRGGIQHCVVVW